MQNTKLNQLTHMFLSHTADGKPRYEHRQIEDLMALAFLSFPPEERSNTTAAVHQLLINFAERASIPKHANPEKAQAAIDSYLEKNPLPPELVDKLSELGPLQDVSSLNLGATFSKFMDDNTRLKPLDTGERPAGSIAAGPLARFSGKKKFDGQH